MHTKFRMMVFITCIAPGCGRDAAKDEAFDPLTAAVKAEGRLPVLAVVSQGRLDVEKFFGGKFPRPFEIRVVADRAGFDKLAAERWGMPQTQCWMVGVGTASVLGLLDPAAWKTDACEHDPDDADHLQRLVTHEMVHVFHGQHCPRPEFDGMDEMGWFVEGLAVHASGQLDDKSRARLRRALSDGKGPATLADVWSGAIRYPAAGTLIEYVESKHGRGMLVRLMAVTTNAEAMALLGTTEQRLLADWRAFVMEAVAGVPALRERPCLG